MTCLLITSLLPPLSRECRNCSCGRLSDPVHGLPAPLDLVSKSMKTSNFQWPNKLFTGCSEFEKCRPIWVYLMNLGPGLVCSGKPEEFWTNGDAFPESWTLPVEPLLQFKTANLLRIPGKWFTLVTVTFLTSKPPKFAAI